jgi:hypothetical protein
MALISPKKGAVNKKYWTFNFKCQSFRLRIMLWQDRQMSNECQMTKPKTNNHESTKFRKHEIDCFFCQIIVR